MPGIKLKNDQLMEIKEAFDVFDADGTGLIPFKELRVALRALGFEPKTEDLKRIAENVEKKNLLNPVTASGLKTTGHLDFSDFVNILLDKINERDSKEHITEAFGLFAKNGKISFADLKRVSQEIGENINDEEIHEMIKQADTNNDDQIDLQEFLKILN